MFGEIKCLWLRKDQRRKKSLNVYFLGCWVGTRRGFLGGFNEFGVLCERRKKRQDRQDLHFTRPGRVGWPGRRSWKPAAFSWGEICGLMWGNRRKSAAFFWGTLYCFGVICWGRQMERVEGDSVFYSFI